MDFNVHELNTLREHLAPDGVWKLREKTEALLRGTLRRLPHGKVSDNEERYPTTTQGVRSFLNSFFARHFFQVQDSLLALASGLVLRRPREGGTFSFADIGSGPAVASLALMDMLDCIGELGPEAPQIGKRPIRISVVLDDVSEPCLKVGREMLIAYARETKGRLSLERVVPVSVPFPKSNSQLCRIARLTKPYDLCCLSYAMVPVDEQSGHQALSRGIEQLADACRGADGRILLLQDKFHESLLRKVCRVLGAQAQHAQIKQNVYDTENENSEHTYTFFRSIHPTEKKARTETLGDTAIPA